MTFFWTIVDYFQKIFTALAFFILLKNIVTRNSGLFFRHNIKKKDKIIVIFILSAQSECFLCMKMSAEAQGEAVKTFECTKKISKHEI
jgi:hypothetical protein